MKYVVTFNKVNDFKGLRKLSLQEAKDLLGFITFYQMGSARIVDVETGETIDHN